MIRDLTPDEEQLFRTFGALHYPPQTMAECLPAEDLSAEDIAGELLDPSSAIAVAYQVGMEQWKRIREHHR